MGIDMDTRDVQKEKAWLPIKITLVGMEMDVRDLHWRKALLPMAFTVVGIRTVVIELEINEEFAM